VTTTRFSGKTAIVTGAASGIGREIARQLGAAGAQVLVTDLDRAAVDAVAAEISARGGAAEGMPVDVSDRDQIQAAVDHMVAAHGRLDYMFNNAGVAIFGEVEVVTLDDWDKIIDVNLRGVAYGATIAYRQMVAQGSGHIVNTASVAGLIPVPLQAHYCATKHGVVGMSKTLALEARRHGVEVTVFCPAFVESGMIENNTLRGTMEGTDARKLMPLKPLPTVTAVSRLLKGVERGREFVVTPFYGRAGWWLERLSIPLSDRLHRLTLRETRRRARAARAPDDVRTG
jgi:NAD(P)-dependent dehydrogenase (short-subunit alcohol dehydrogenase family)